MWSRVATPMRKTTASVLLGVSLLATACSKRLTSGAADQSVAQASPVATSAAAGSATSGNTEAYHDYGKNPWVETAKDHLSTFAADVDTASYTIARRKLNEGTLPPAAAVRVEEFVNYFRYAFAPPSANSPFSVVMDASPSPLQPGRDIVRVAIA